MLITDVIKSILKFGGEDEEEEVELLYAHLMTFINLKIAFFSSFYCICRR